MFCKKGVASGLQSIKTEAQVLSCEFYELSKNTFFKERPWVIAFIHLKLLGSKYDLFGKLWGFRGNLRLIFAQKRTTFTDGTILNQTSIFTEQMKHAAVVFLWLTSMVDFNTFR